MNFDSGFLGSEIKGINFETIRSFGICEAQEMSCFSCFSAQGKKSSKRLNNKGKAQVPAPSPLPKEPPPQSRPGTYIAFDIFSK